MPGLAPGSFRAICAHYYASPAFRALDDGTRNWRRRALDRIAEQNGNNPIALMEPRHVRQLSDEMAVTPGAASNRLKALKAMFSWAVEEERTKTNPAKTVKLLSYKTDGHHARTEQEISKFEAAHSVGTKARLAMSILLHTACRREEAVRLGPQHIRDGRARFVQAKNEHRSPVAIDIPVLRGRSPRARPGIFLFTEFGKPFTPAGFGNRFARQISSIERGGKLR